MNLEVVIPIQDKDTRLLEECLKSVKRAVIGMINLHMVDLSSTRSDLYKKMAHSYGLRYSYLDHQEWNKPVAANYALKRTDSDWFGVLDGDYIVEEKFFRKNIKRNWIKLFPAM